MVSMATRFLNISTFFPLPSMPGNRLLVVKRGVMWRAQQFRTRQTSVEVSAKTDQLLRGNWVNACLRCENATKGVNGLRFSSKSGFRGLDEFQLSIICLLVSKDEKTSKVTSTVFS